MPDKRRHRGRHPDDQRLFAASRVRSLRTAVAELSWLLTRGYAELSALKIVGDRHDLTVRQRMAVRRSACPDAALARRAATHIDGAGCAGRTLGVDGYNLLITVESALSGGLVIVGRDGCYRDLASIHGTYRKVEETAPAIELVAGYLASLDVAGVDWYLDRPVSNSGRLKALIAEVLDREKAGGPAWNIELVASPDRVLVDYPDPVVTSDSVILDGCAAWSNLAADIVARHVPDAWVLDLRPND